MKNRNIYYLPLLTIMIGMVLFGNLLANRKERAEHIIVRKAPKIIPTQAPSKVAKEVIIQETRTKASSIEK